MGAAASTTINPDRVLRELSDLWVSLGAHDGDESTGVLRACAMTLVVIAEAAEDENAIGETLAALMREHPSRVIVIRVAESAEPSLEARVLAQCWMPFGQRRQICCEQIEIKASNASLADLATVVLPLVAADLPMILWSRRPRLLSSPELRDLARIASKNIIDGGRFPDPRQAPERLLQAAADGLRLGDLAWTRLTRWRELIAQIFENPIYFAQLSSVARVVIYYPDAVPPLGVRYLSAWLSVCLEKTGNNPPIDWARGEGPADGGLNRVDFVSKDPSGLNVSIHKVDGSAEVQVNALVNRTVFPEASDYVLLREELSITGRDRIYEAALARAGESARDR